VIFQRLRTILSHYPPQFQLMFWGMLISTLGTSMIWPFLLIYVSDRLAMPLTTIASLISLNASIGLISSFFGGPVTDRAGRKWVMAISLMANGLVYLFLSQANTYPQFAILLGLSGAASPLYRVGSDAMLADLIPPENRIDAYALLRLSNNLGISLGPALGGFVAAGSYAIAFYCAAGGMIFYSLLLLLFARETLPSLLKPRQLDPTLSIPASSRMTDSKKSGTDSPLPDSGGYLRVLRDKPFMLFTSLFTLTTICAVLIWILMPVFAKNHFSIPENQYGFIPTTNALMVVTLQVWITQHTKQYSPYMMMTLGAFFYALGVGSVALAGGFWGFWVSMIIMTTGELILVPTSSTYVANQAPPDMRGRYMSIYGLTWGVSAAIAPILGGYLSDVIHPSSPWYSGLLVGLVAAAGYQLLKRYDPQQIEFTHQGDSP
jgi:MFS family permease